jgi:hypothetical protein
MKPGEKIEMNRGIRGGACEWGQHGVCRGGLSVNCVCVA